MIKAGNGNNNGNDAKDDDDKGDTNGWCKR